MAKAVYDLESNMAVFLGGLREMTKFNLKTAKSFADYQTKLAGDMLETVSGAVEEGVNASLDLAATFFKDSRKS